MTDFQVMPPLSDAEYDMLKADIAERGVLQSIGAAKPCTLSKVFETDFSP